MISEKWEENVWKPCYWYWQWLARKKEILLNSIDATCWVSEQVMTIYRYDIKKPLFRGRNSAASVWPRTRRDCVRGLWHLDGRSRWLARRRESGRQLPLSDAGDRVSTRVGKELEPSENEPNHIPGFAKNRTEPEHSINVRVVAHSFTEWNRSYIRTFHNKRGILLYLG